MFAINFIAGIAGGRLLGAVCTQDISLSKLAAPALHNYKFNGKGIVVFRELRFYSRPVFIHDILDSNQTTCYCGLSDV
jgi:hypothetical protein